MPITIFLELLSAAPLVALPAESGYVSIPKLVLFLLAVILWAQNAAWVQKDTTQLRIRSGTPVFAIFGTGLLCLVVWLFVPLFWIGGVLFAVLYGPAILWYVFFRNRRVSPAKTVLSMAHLQRLTQGQRKKGGAESEHAKDRTRITNAEGKTPSWPKDPPEKEAYQALQDLLFDAIWRRASTVKMALMPQQPLKIIYKIDGVNRTREPLSVELAPLILKRLKRIGGLDPEERRRPQAGRFSAAIGAVGSAEKSVDIDIKTSGSTAGEKCRLQLVSEESKFRIPDLGLTQEQVTAVEALVREPKGVLITGGPRGSGVTSTQYAILRSHDVFMQNIHTLELAKAQDLENISQHEFDSQDGAISFGKRLRSVLRVEPDVCLISDLADAETAALAAAAGRQGKSIYLGVQAKDTFAALQQYLQGVNDNALAAGSLLGITCQRLLRVLCPNCRRGYKPDPALLKKANLPLDADRPFYKPPNPNELETDKRGEPIICEVCQGSGYLGRTGVFELLVFDDELRHQLGKGVALANLKTLARKKGLQYLQEVALRKVYDGISSINEVLRVTQESSSGGPRR